MRAILTSLLLTCCAAAAQAETFDLALGGKTIGTLTWSASALRSDVNNSPLGVANGVFEASARPVRTDTGVAVTQYLGTSYAKNRTISVLMQEGRALETVVSPASESTDLSDPASVPAGVTHPVAALGRLVRATGCPGGFSFYDGRRVITVTPDASAQDGTTLTCSMRYRVTAGPGHLSPLYISRVALTATYDTAGGQRLQALRLRAGPFTLNVTAR